LILHPDSHVDHVPPEILEYALARCAGRSGFFVETFDLPPDFPPLDCALYGPACGDPPVAEAEVFYATRAGRLNESRMIHRPLRKTRTCTVIAGPLNDQPCVLYTLFGGPAAPREATDPNLQPEKREESLSFWRQHALANSP